MSTQHSGGAGTVVYSLKTPRIHIVKVTVSLAALRAAQEEEVLRFIRFQLEFSQMFRQQQDNMEVTAHCLRLELHAETSSSSHHFIQVFLFLRTVFTIVMVALLLLLVGLLHFRKL
ncbi:hypothetical protein Q8A73_012682 [Channa argus]|nr:hypothetical protein Q8A73_012682 [Channa argus]